MADQLTTRDLAGRAAAEDTAEQANAGKGSAEQATTDRDVADGRTEDEELPGKTESANEAGTDAGDLQPNSTDHQTGPKAATAAKRDERGPLLPDDQSERFSGQWQE